MTTYISGLGGILCDKFNLMEPVLRTTRLFGWEQISWAWGPNV